MNQKYEKEYCMVCGNINPQDREICECGGRNFVYGNKFTYEDKKVVCNCGSDQFKTTFHMNTNPIYIKNYKCIFCGNIIGMQTYYKSPYYDE